METDSDSEVGKKKLSFGLGIGELGKWARARAQEFRTRAWKFWTQDWDCVFWARGWARAWPGNFRLNPGNFGLKIDVFDFIQHAIKT